MCGQAADVERYTFSSFLRELYNNVRKVDITATFATALALLRAPGEFIHGYLTGKRVGYINPIKFFFYAMIADVFVNEVLFRFTGDKAFSTPLTGSTVVQLVGLLATIFWGILWKLFYRKSEFNIVEFAVCAIYFETQTDLLASVFLLVTAPFLIPSISNILVSVDLLLTAAYGFYFAHQVFKETWFMTLIKQTVLIILFLSFLTAILSS